MKSFPLILFLILLSFSSFAQINNEKIKLYIVKFDQLSQEQISDLTIRGIIGKEWQSKKYEIREEQKAYLDHIELKYTIIEFGIMVNSPDPEPNANNKDFLDPGKGETNKSGSNSTDYNIPDLGSAYSNITISGALTGSIASRIVYSWNIDHNYITDVYVRCGTSNWNDGDIRLSATGDDILDGYNQTSSASRTSYPSNPDQSVNQIWTLVASDKYAGDLGRIDSWSLTVYYTADPPVVFTLSATSIGLTSAYMNGTVNPGNLSTSCYFQYGTTTSYGSVTSTQTLNAGTSNIPVSQIITGLPPNTTYHYRLVATNNAGTGYGNDFTFTTLASPPTVVTSSATSITTRSVQLNGTVNPKGVSTTYYFDYGSTTSYGNSTTSKSAGSGVTTLTESEPLDYLNAGSTFHYRIVAINAGGTSYGNDISFTTTALSISTSAPSSNIIVTQGQNVTLTWSGTPSSGSVLLRRDNDNIWDNGNETSITSLQPASGTYPWSTTSVPLGTYYIGSMISDGNSAKYAYASGRVIIIKLPAVTTGGYPSLSSNTATVTGTVNPNNASTTAWVEYGTTTSYGSTTASQSVGSGTSDISLNFSLSGLTAGVTYHYRVVAQNSAGKTNGSDMTFSTFLLNISVPSSNITVTQGSNVSITWNGMPSSATVQLRRDLDNIWDSGNETSISTFQPASGTFSWSTGSVPLGTYYIGALISDGQNLINAYAPGKVTIINQPGVVTGGYPNLSSNTATVTGTVNPNNSSTTAWVEYGTTTSYGSTTASQSVGSGTSDISLNFSLSSLTAGVTYHYRVVAQNSAGKTNGSDMTFSTFLLNISVPSSNITVTQGSNVSITWNGMPSSATVQLRRDLDNIWDSGNETSISTFQPASGTFSWSTGSVPLGTYYIGALISDGQNLINAYAPGKVSIIKKPGVTTGGSSNITGRSAVVLATVNPNFSQTNAWIEYGTTVSYGSSTAIENGGSGTNDISMNFALSGLNSSTTYHYRIVGTNSAGTSYGSDMSFTTLSLASTILMHPADLGVGNVPFNFSGKPGTLVRLGAVLYRNVLGLPLVTIDSKNIRFEVQLQSNGPWISIPEDGITTTNQKTSFAGGLGENYYIIPDNLSNGQYGIRAIFDGDEEYASSSLTGILTVNASNSDLVPQWPTFSSSDKIPLILVHGNGSDESTPLYRWETFINYINSRPKEDFSKFDIYIWKNDTELPIGFNGTTGNAKELATYVDNVLSKYNVGTKVIFVAHSRGGLVCRSYMNYNNQGNKVLGLITLGTPHHGSPSAVPDWCAWVWGNNVNTGLFTDLESKNLFNIAVNNTPTNLLFIEAEPGFDYDRIGSLNLAWDNEDVIMSSYFSFNWAGISFSNNGQIQFSSRDLNNNNQYDDATILYSDLCKSAFGTLKELNSNALSNPQNAKIITYGAYDDNLNDNGPLSTGALLAYKADNNEHKMLGWLTELMIHVHEGISSNTTYVANDGMVPLQSALFLDISNGTQFSQNISGNITTLPSVETKKQVKLQRIFYGTRDGIKDHLSLLDASIDDPKTLNYWNTLANDIRSFIPVDPPTIGTVTQPTCTLATGSVVLSGLPATGIWSLTRTPDGITTTGTGTSTTISGLPAGTYTYTVTNALGSTSVASANVVINAQPKPATPVISFNSSILHSTGTNGNQWYNQSGLINGATNQDFIVSSNGVYYVIITIAGCSSDPSNSINVLLTGNNEFVKNSKVIKVYPNPVSNELIIEIDGGTDKTEFEILNAKGQSVFKGSMFEKTVVQTTDFSPGIYIIIIANGNTFEFKKIVK